MKHLVIKHIRYDIPAFRRDLAEKRSTGQSVVADKRPSVERAGVVQFIRSCCKMRVFGSGMHAVYTRIFYLFNFSNFKILYDTYVGRVVRLLVHRVMTDTSTLIPDNRVIHSHMYSIYCMYAHSVH